MKIPASTSRVRTSFDPELELPKLHQWFAENPHPSRLTLQMYLKELNSLASRQSRKSLEVHNLCYWFKNARAAYKRAELRLKKNHEHQKVVIENRADSTSSQSAAAAAAVAAKQASMESAAAVAAVAAAAAGAAATIPQPPQLQPLLQPQPLATLNNFDLAQAVNCLLKAASLLPGPSSAAAINLAANLLNSNLVNTGGQLVDSTAAATLAAAAVLNNQLNQPQYNNHNQVASIATSAQALVDQQHQQPMRQLFTAFNPSNYQFALGMLDNKVLDSNILNAMTFPTSACAVINNNQNHNHNNNDTNHHRHSL